MQARLLCQEEIGALDDVLEVGFSVRVDERSHVGDVDSLGATTTGHKQVSLEPQMSSVSEVGAIEDDLARYRSMSK